MPGIEDLTFTGAALEDIPVLYSLCKELIDRYEDLSQIHYDKVLKWVRTKITENISRYTCIWLGAEKVGYYFLDASEGQIELDDFYILPQFRCHGIGTAVLRHCVSSADLPMYLYVFQKNEGAIKLYKQIGFYVAEEVSKTRYIMRRDVDSTI